MTLEKFGQYRKTMSKLIVTMTKINFILCLKQLYNYLLYFRFQGKIKNTSVFANKNPLMLILQSKCYYS